MSFDLSLTLGILSFDEPLFFGGVYESESWPVDGVADEPVSEPPFDGGVTVSVSWPVEGSVGSVLSLEESLIASMADCEICTGPMRFAIDTVPLSDPELEDDVLEEAEAELDDGAE